VQDESLAPAVELHVAFKALGALVNGRGKPAE
jgi:hypothetical protein